MKPTAWLLFASALAAAPASAQPAHQHSNASAQSSSDHLGEIDFPNSGKPAAQPDFIRGVKLLHNFQYEDAVKAFQSAISKQPLPALAARLYVALQASGSINDADAFAVALRRINRAEVIS